MRVSILFLLIGLTAIENGSAVRLPSAALKEKLRYDNYAVYKFFIQSKTQSAVLRDLDNSQKYNIWKEYDDNSKEAHVMVSSEDANDFQRLMESYQIDIETMIHNVQDLIDEEEVDRSLADNNNFGWKRYYELPEIEAWLDEILKTYANVTEGFQIGKSYEGRTIRGIKISYKANNPGIFIESNIHACEWITSSTATWLIKELLTSQKTEVRQLAENYDWYIIPVFNVDGFVYSHEKDRLWKKTRQPIQNSLCSGIDLNRNFDFHWSENNGSSFNPCHFRFHGPRPFSEPESVALSEYVKSLKGKINIYLALHSFVQSLLSPYGHTTTEFPPNYNDLEEIGEAFVNAIGDLSYQTKYKHGSFANALYVGSGTSVDWVYHTQGVKVAYTVELHAKDRFHFVLPPVQIIPNCEEFMAGLLALVSKAKDLKYV